MQSVSVVDGTSRRHVVAVAPAEAQLAVDVDAVVLDAQVVLECLARLLQLLQRLVHVNHLRLQLLERVADLMYLLHQSNHTQDTHYYYYVALRCISPNG